MEILQYLKSRIAVCEDNNFLNDKFYVYRCISFDDYLVGDLGI